MDCVTKLMRRPVKCLSYPNPETIETAVLFMLSQFSLFFVREKSGAMLHYPCPGKWKVSLLY